MTVNVTVTQGWLMRGQYAQKKNDIIWLNKNVSLKHIFVFCAYCCLIQNRPPWFICEQSYQRKWTNHILSKGLVSVPAIMNLFELSQLAATFDKI